MSAISVDVDARGLDAAVRRHAGVVLSACTWIVRDEVGNGLIFNEPVVGVGTVKGVGCAGGVTAFGVIARVAGAGGRIKLDIVTLILSRAIIISASAVDVDTHSLDAAVRYRATSFFVRCTEVGFEVSFQLIENVAVIQITV